MKEYQVGDVIRTPEGFWLNSDVFRQDAIRFMKTGLYCSDPSDSPAYTEYWDEQLRRCREGYEVADEKITGHHYSYLNFCQIQIVMPGEDPDSPTAKKVTKCPDFWDGDFDYYWCLELAKNGVTTSDSLLTTKEQKQEINKLPIEERKIHWLRIVENLRMRVKPHPDFLDGGHHMIVGKSRRKGYSYKNGDICANVYNTERNSLTIIGAFDKKFLYPKGTMGMASAYLSFLNNNTAWTKGREYVDKQEHKRASFKKTKEGAVVEAGYMSEIMALTFKDNPAAARGKDAKYVLFEEAGVFPNLKESYAATQPGLEAGRYITGQIIIFGTGGDMESGTVDFAEMFYDPIQFNLMPFENIWDENGMGTYCGFFHPVYLNMEGFYDSQGNSDVAGALRFEKEIRDKLKKASTSSSVIQMRVQEYPTCPSEAFLTVGTNDFPIVELRAQYNRVVRDNLNIKIGQPVYLKDVPATKAEDTIVVDEEGNIRRSTTYVLKVKVEMDLEGRLNPIWDFRPKSKDLQGAVVIYEHPVYNPPFGLYKIGFDPYRQVDGTSLAAIYVYKTVRRGDATKNVIAAQYIGRPYSPNEVNRICVQLCELYNTEVMHENEVTHVKDYFETKRKLHLLAAQPDTVISNAIKDSKVKRIYGIHMIEKLKDAGEKYIKEWLLEVRDYDTDGKALRNIDFIYDPALLQELILYNRKKGNFDRVMALMMVMFQIAEEIEGKEYSTQEYTSNEEDLLNLMNSQFTNPRFRF